MSWTLFLKRAGAHLLLPGCYLIGLWCLGALWYAFFPHSLWRYPLCLIFLAWLLGLPWLMRRDRRLLWGTLALEAGLIVAFLQIHATNAHQWQPSFARMPQIEFNRPRPGWVTIRDIRDFEYRSVSDFTAHYRTESYDLDTLESVDFILVHWGMKAIGHTMLSFGFRDGRRLVLSVETRVPLDAEQGTLPGLYKQLNLIMIAGTERDLLGLRTNFRHEEVYLYATNTMPWEARELLTDLLQRAEQLRRHPKFYNTLTANCTNTLAPSVRRVWSLDSARSIILNGNIDEIARDAGWLRCDDPAEPFADFKMRHYVNPRVDTGGALPPDYSERLRANADN